MSDSASPSVRWPLRAHLQLGAVLALAAAVLALALYAVTPRSFTSRSGVVGVAPAPNALATALAPLGALGIAAGTQNNSPQFIAALLSSRDVLDTVVRRRFPQPGRGDSVMLATILTDVAQPSPEELARARDMLGGSTATSVDTRTGIVELRVTLRDPELARRVNAAIIHQADQANQAMHRRQASHRRDFTEERLRIAQQQLDAAEEQLRRFRQTNAVRTSPALQLQEERLQRLIMSRQDVYTSLARDHEQALQEEARNLPSLSLFLEPDRPWRKSRPRGSLYLAAGVGAGVFLATLLVLLAVMQQPADAARARTARQLLQALRPRRRTAGRG